MKITKNKLKQIIKEELTKVLNERTETETREGTFRQIDYRSDGARVFINVL